MPKEVEKTTVTVYRPIKDLNGMVQGFEPIEVEPEKAESVILPGGLLDRPKY
jgi:hypothetical protein